MQPKQREFERVSTDDFIVGVISNIEYDMEHKSTWKGEEKIGAAVRIKFNLEGYQYQKYSGWMSFQYGEKTNLFKKYLSSLVEGAQPNMKFDLDQLKNMRVKILFKDSEDGKYQNVDTIRPAEKKIVPDPKFTPSTEEEAVPF
jgi:hypothetical protein